MNKEKVIQIAKEKGLEPLENLPNDVKKYAHYSFIDKYGYKYFLCYDQLRDERSGHAIVKSQNPFSLENIQTYIYNNNGKATVISKEWKNERNKITLKCEKCGKEFKVSWYHIYSLKKFTCNKCSYSNPYNKKSEDEALKICKKHGYDIVKGTYISNHHFDIIDKDGYKYSNSSIYSLDKRNNKTKKFDYNNKYQIENILLYFKLNNLNAKFANKNQKNFRIKTDKIDFICCECGNIYQAYFGEVIGQHKDISERIRCDKCSNKQSGLEYLVEKYLKEKKINYIKEKKFDWCKNIRYLPFDFYLNDYNTVIEVNGSQHYYENSNWNFSLEKQKERDKYKEQCCKKNNVKYVVIPYWLITQSKTQTYKKIIDNIID
jgi:very-short-patch-repair endonuclease